MARRNRQLTVESMRFTGLVSGVGSFPLGVCCIALPSLNVSLETVYPDLLICIGCVTQLLWGTSISRGPGYWTLPGRPNGEFLGSIWHLGGREPSKELLIPLRSWHERFMSVSQEERSVFQFDMSSSSLQDIDH